MALLAGVVWGIYGRALRAPLIFDDIESTVENPSITRLWPLVGDSARPGPLNRLPSSPVAGRPLVNLSLAVNYQFGALNPAGYRAVNISLHILSALLLFGIVRRTLRMDHFGGTLERACDKVALLVALLWAAHPLQTEAVVYVTQRTELMMGGAYLATLYSSIRHWTATSPTTRRWWLAAAALACLAGMASKEVMVTAPVVVLLFHRTFIAESLRGAWHASRALYAVLALSWLMLVLLNAGGPRGGSAGFDVGIPPHVWWFTQAKALALYLKLVLWPRPLAIHYDFPLVRTLGAALPWVLPAALGAAAWLVLMRRGRPLGLMGAMVFLILAPTLLVPIKTEVVAERRMYLPLAALFAFAVVAGYQLVRRSLPRDGDTRTPRRAWLMPTAAGALVLMLLSWTVGSARRAALYNDEVALWANTVASQPNDALAHYNLGVALGDHDRLDEAIREFETALRLDPNYPSAHFNVAVALSERRRPHEAIPHFEVEMRSGTPNASAHLIFGITLGQAGRATEAVAQFERSIRLARLAGDSELAAAAEAWLERYRATQRADSTAPARPRTPPR